jgi:DNA-binding NarL/FixJ family response regulator
VADDIRILIADDHPVVRKGLRDAIEAGPNLKVVAEASDGEAALQYIETLRPQIAVLDIDMPKRDGLAVAREVLRRQLPVRLVLLTIHAEADIFNAAMDLGVQGYVLKESALFEIVNGLLAVAAGQYYVSSSLTALLLRRRGPGQASADVEQGLDTLSESERRILRMIAADKSSKQIADELCIHYRTVENRRTAICQKLGLRGPNALLKFALQNKPEL